MDGWRARPRISNIATSIYYTHQYYGFPWRRMVNSHELLIGLYGIVIRLGLCSIYGQDMIPLSLQKFLIPLKYSLNTITECLFLKKLLINENNLDHECPNSMILNMISPSLYHPYLYLLSGTLLQYLIFLYLNQSHSPSNTIAYFYWFNPLTILSSILSPIPSIHHVLIISTLYLLANHSSILFAVPFILLVLSDLQHLPLLFSIYSLYQYYHKQRESSSPKYSLTQVNIAVIGVAILLAYTKDHISSVILNTFHSPPLKHFNPGSGMIWYLQAQIFPEYSNYFMWFLRFQPYITAILLWLRLSEFYPLVSVYISYSIILIFSETSNYSDLFFSFCCLFSLTSITTSMRYLPLLLFILIVSSILSPSMYSLWIYEGYGNPNFLFFQNIAFTLGHIFFIIEYTRSAMKQRKQRVHICESESLRS